MNGEEKQFMWIKKSCATEWNEVEQVLRYLSDRLGFRSSYSRFCCAAPDATWRSMMPDSSLHTDHQDNGHQVRMESASSKSCDFDELMFWFVVDPVFS